MSPARDPKGTAYLAGRSGKPLPAALRGNEAAERAHALGRRDKARGIGTGIPSEAPAERRTPESRANPTSRNAGHRVRRKAAQTARRGVRVLGIGAQLFRLAWLMFGLVVLYLLLTSAKGVTGVLALLQKGVAWVVSPTATI